MTLRGCMLGEAFRAAIKSKLIVGLMFMLITA